MESRSEGAGARGTLGVVVRLVVLVVAAVFSQGQGCSNLFNPTSTSKSGAQQCAELNALYCNSYSIPQTLSYNAPGACCVVATNANAGVGYMCAYGANKISPGCFATSDDAWSACTAAYGQPVSVVRCTK
jgi:hypothetical protein